MKKLLWVTQQTSVRGDLNVGIKLQLLTQHWVASMITRRRRVILKNGDLDCDSQ